MKHIFDLLDDNFKSNLSYLQRIANKEEETVIYFGNGIDVSFSFNFEWWKKNKDFTIDFSSYKVRFCGCPLMYDDNLCGTIEARNVRI